MGGFIIIVCSLLLAAPVSLALCRAASAEAAPPREGEGE